MNSLKQLAVVAVAAVLTCTGLYAQSIDLRATIPFDFQAGQKLMPAGEYSIHSQSGFVVLNNVNGHASAAVVTNSVIGPSSNQDARLDFKRYGDAYFLTTIWGAFSGEGRQVPQTARERELAKRSVPAKPAAVLASNHK